MADTEDVAMAEPALLARQSMYLVLEEKVRDFLTRYKTANHGTGEEEEDDVVAVEAEPQEHARWILIFLMTVGAVSVFAAAMHMPF